MVKKLTRAERYKRNYRIIKNTYQNTTLAKRAQTWGDDRLYKDLGIKVSNKKTPVLKKIKHSQQSYYNRKLDKFVYARSVGFTPKESKKFVKYKQSKIDSSKDYQDVSAKRLNFQNRKKRLRLWREWSSHDEADRGNMPPEIEKIARERNKKTKVAGKQLDEFAKYGYVVAFYQFVHGRDFEDIKDFVNPDPHDALRVRYETTVRAV